MIDIGVNLLHEQFAGDRRAVLERASAAGVETLLITCTRIDMILPALQLCEAHRLYCTAGVHPHDAAAAAEDFDVDLRALVDHPAVKAVGETGLDFNRNFSPRETQREVFARQLAIAADAGKPVFVHDRDTDGEVYETLRPLTAQLRGVVIHCFTGTATDLECYLGAGFYIGVTGWVCDPRRGALLRELVPEIPLDRLLIETDAPFLLPRDMPRHWHADNGITGHPRRNEPALLGVVAARIAALRKIPVAEVAAVTAANARRLFQL